MESGIFSDTSVWRSHSADCVWARYDDHFVVFHRPSGKTHFLNSAGYRLLTEILENPAGIVTIAEKLADGDANEHDSLTAEAVHEMLVRFEYLGLVDRRVSGS